MNNEPYIIERILNAPITHVWKAITDEHEMRQWYFDLPGFKAEVGYKFQFTAGADCKFYVHNCEVTEVIPVSKIAYTWSYDGYEGNSLVTWELFDEGGKTRLKLTHSGLETFPASNPDLAKTNFIAGWTDIIGRSLVAFVEKL